ncbi:uncharacterized protein [Primulina eburnea]|uniref:uncharacterized protein n=1 Tax=Primulina eburnea TaxID=1245227 RepID=UPI003C6CA64C
MDKLARGPVAKNVDYDVNELNGVGIDSDSHTLLIIKLPDSWVLRVLSRILFLAMIILALSSIGSMLRTSSNVALFKPDADADMVNGFKILPLLLRDLLEEGLIKKGQKGFVLGAGNGDNEDDFQFLKETGIDLLVGADLQRKNVVEPQAFDFVFTWSLRRIHLFDGVLKEGALVISPLGSDPLPELQLLSSYKIVYLRRFENTVVAMRKKGQSSYGVDNSPAKHTSSGVTPEEKKAALKNLEDVYLEPPRLSTLMKKPSFTSRKIKFLPDLLKDSLDEYPRRIFISDDLTALDWFYKNYPMRDQEFEVYDMEIVTNNDAPSQRATPQDMGISTWLTKNVKREDYVVMKAEAQVVEGMLRDRTLSLVDELFLECRNQWQDGEKNGSKRAYWQCLALYGKVKDEGIAVHQWWN